MTAASIWVDADACPKVIKEILFRAAERTGVVVTLVANRPLAIPRVPSLRGGPPALTQADRSAFANQLDKWLAQRAKS